MVLSKPKLIAGAVAVAVLAVGGIAFVTMSGSGDHKSETAGAPGGQRGHAASRRRTQACRTMSLLMKALEKALELSSCAAALASIRPSCPPPKMPMVSPGGIMIWR